MRTASLCGLLLLPLCTPLGAQTQEVRVVIYNVQFLPLIVRMANKRNNVPYRARTIARKLAASADIVGFNEVYDYQARRLLIDGFKQAWGKNVYHLIHPKGKNRVSGGLLIVSRYPLIETHAMHYKHASQFKNYGFTADGLASKGVLHARVKLSQTLQLDLFVTHLEARSSAMRRKQYPELAAFIKQHRSPDRPTILLGDLNTSGGTRAMANPKSPYQLLMKTLQPMVDLWPVVNKQKMMGTSDQHSKSGGRRIDYIMANVPKALQARFEPIKLSVNQFQDPKVKALSDHSAVFATFRYK